MARGYPDFFGFSIFPSFGIPTEENSGWVVVGAGTTPVLVDIAGKGKSYGGELWFDGNEDACDLAQPIVIIDGVTFNDVTAEAHLIYGQDLCESRFTRLICSELQHATASRGAFAFGKDFTWGQSLSIALNNATAANMNAWCRLRWARVR